MRMSMASRKRVYLLIIVLLQLILFDVAELYSGPKLNISSYEHILKTGEDFAVLCEGNGKLEWDLEDIYDNEEYSEYTEIDTIPTTPQSEGYTTAIELRITNITFPYVGIYYCMNKENGSSAPAALYIYVNDENYLASKDILYEVNVVITQGNSVTLPCIPTAPDVEVTLIKEVNDEMISIELGSYLDGKYYEYSQFGGITTDDTAQIQLNKYRCFFRRGNFSVSYPITVDVEPKTHSISKPQLFEINRKLRNIVGGTIAIRCQVKSHVRVDMTWTVPMYEEDDTDERMDVSDTKRDPKNPDFMYTIITITNTTMEDVGLYKCKVNDFQEHENENIIFISIFEHLYILLSEEGCAVERKDEDQNIKCSVGITAHPLPNVTWWKNRNGSLAFDSFQNYKEINSTYMEAWLEIKNISHKDIGQYTLVAVNEYDNANLTYLVDLIAKPDIELKLEKEFQILGKKTVAECKVSAYPEPFVELFYKPCFDNSCEFEILDNVHCHQDKDKRIARVEYTFSKSGIIKCVALQTVLNDVQEEEKYEKEIGLFISDIETGFGIESLGEVQSNDDYHLVVVTIDDSVEIKCAAYIQDFPQMIKWKRDSKEITSGRKYRITKSSTQFSNASILNISDININDRGYYTCELYKLTGENEELIRSQNVAFSMSSYVAPVITKSNLNSTMEVSDGVELELICIFKGVPKPVITWYKNNDILTSSDSKRISDDGQKLSFFQTSMKDEGLYKCEGQNVWGIKKKETKIIFKSKSGVKWYLVIIGILTMLVLVASITTYTNHIKKKKFEKILEDAGLTNFEEGQLDNLNPALEIGDQVELLPYDRKYEFSYKNLKLGKILGSGAFGVVVQGEARGILPDEKVTTVAVKMVDRNAQHEHIKALVTELKIMIYLGKHLNVVNLLGACTKNIARRELLVIEEYCRYGNLRTYLYKCRDNFINQINPQTGQINFEIEEDVSYGKISSSQSNWMNLSKYDSQDSSGNVDEFNSKCLQIDQTSDIMQRNCIPRNSIFSESVNSDEEAKSSTETKCNSNYDKEYKGYAKPLSTTDLLSWSFQVARGMEYLVSRRVLHGDLAARNILLADDAVVKICDFGLSKRTYRIENYKKISDGPLPVKWMAIESIRDRVFSSQSDVWSFGIVLWEFFSLAKTPYPGIEADENLFAKLEQGYRMEAPKFSNNSIYELMQDCWSANPPSRPTFTSLSERLGSMLEDSVRMHYIKLNDPYLMINSQHFREKDNDYLTMVTPTSLDLSLSPQSFSDGKKPSSGYLNMTRSASLQSQKIEVDAGTV